MPETPFEHPLDPANGRYLCSPENPMPSVRPPGSRWAHTNLREVGEQQDGWPGGDLQRVECPDCGYSGWVELPQ